MNYYEVLGLKRDASEAEIKKAYRDLVKKAHPDSGDPGDVERFRLIQAAYETLSDRERRRSYDARPLGPMSWTGGFEAPFTPFREVRPPRAQEPSVHLDIVLSIEEARRGGDVVLEAPREHECAKCVGRGLGFFGWCSACHGEGRLRVYERILFRVPAGARHGEVITSDGGMLRGRIRVR